MQALDARDELLERARQWDDGALQAVPARSSGTRVPPSLNGDAPPSAIHPWEDKLQSVPAIRSALIGLPPHEDTAGWSKPFTLTKADFEPWLTYYAGYCSSRLFLARRQPEHGVPQPDFPVRALLQLRGIDARLILEPPVQIDGPVKFFEAASAAERRDPGLAASLSQAADAMHRSQLRRAFERGCQMGNDLHDALLGEGLVRLIGAWNAVHRRQPNAHELHLMLTTGRTTPVHPEPVAPAPAVARARSQPMSADVWRRRADPASFPGPALMSTRQRPVPAARQMPTDQSAEPLPFARKQREHRPWWWYLAHASALIGAAAFLYEWLN